jgi:hypothetical protein
VPPEVLSQWQSRPLYTCCNLHYSREVINDANYDVGGLLPFGSAVTIDSMTEDAVTFHSGATRLTLEHAFGKNQQSSQQYFSKIFVETNPHDAFVTYPASVQDAIRDGRVERGMTKEQVLMSIGYPPIHRTASTDLDTWLYWYNRWTTYQVQFGANGKVSAVRGSNAPTDNRAIVMPSPTPTEAPSRRGRPR